MGGVCFAVELPGDDILKQFPASDAEERIEPWSDSSTEPAEVNRDTFNSHRSVVEPREEGTWVRRLESPNNTFMVSEAAYSNYTFFPSF